MFKRVSKRRNERAVSYNEIVTALRQEIIDGKLSSGARLPTCDDLQHRFGAARMTVHRACRHLVSLGYAQSRAKIGTFVADFPPHLYRYGIVFSTRPNSPYGFTGFWRILHEAASAIAAAEPPKEFVPYYEIGDHPEIGDYPQLIADMNARRLAGIIMLTPPTMIEKTPLVASCPIARVYIGADVCWRYQIPSVSTDVRSFVGRAVEFATQRGRRRPVMIGPALLIEHYWEMWLEACQLYGATAPARWQLLSVPLNPPEAARHFTQAIMQIAPERRPDALIVADNHLVTEVTAGLLASNIPDAELPLVIAHANYPELPHALAPVTYLGFDSIQIIRACLDALDAPRRGAAPSSRTLIPAVFAEEYATASGIARLASAPRLLLDHEISVSS